MTQYNSLDLKMTNSQLNPIHQWLFWLVYPWAGTKGTRSKYSKLKIIYQ